MSKIFNSILSLNDKLKTSIDNQDSTLLALSIPLAQLDEDVEEVSQLNLDNYKLSIPNIGSFSIEKEVGSAEVTVRNMTTDESITLDKNTDFDSVKMPSTDVSLEQAILTLNEGEASNLTIYEINQAFLNKANVSTAAIRSIINDTSSLPDEDRQKLLSAVNAVDDKGAINGRTWLTIFATMAQDCDDSFENNDPRFEVDESSAFTLKSFLTAVLSVIATIVSVVLSAISNALAFIFMAISTVLSYLTSAATAAVDADISIDSDSLSSCARGCLCPMTALPLDSVYNQVFDGVLSELSACQFWVGPIQMLMWKDRAKTADDIPTLSANGYLDFSLSGDRVWEEVRAKTGAYANGNTVTIFPRGLMPMEYSYDGIATKINARTELHDMANSSLWLSDDEEIRLRTDKGFLARQYKLLTLLAAFSLVGYKITNNQTFSWTYIGSGYGPDPIKSMVAKSFAYLRLLALGTQSDADSFLGNVSYSDAANFWTAVTNENHGVRKITEGETTYLSDVSSSDCWIFSDGVYLHKSFVHELRLYSDDYETLVFISPFGIGDQIQSSIVPVRMMIDTRLVDFATPELSINLPSWDFGAVVALLAVVAAVSVAAFIGAKAIKSSLRTRKALKQTKRTQVVREAADAYKKNPNDPTAKENYAKAVKSYNRKASWFGWSSYNAENGTFVSTGSATATGSAFAGISTKLQEMSGINELDAGKTASIQDAINLINPAYLLTPEQGV